MARTIGVILNLKDKFSGALRGIGQNTKKFTVQLNQAEKFTQKIEKGLLNVGKAVTAISAVSIGAGIKSFADYDNAVRQVAASTGTSLKDMGTLKRTMQNIYSDNYGESWEDVGNSISTVQRYLGNTGESISEATKNAIVLRDTFGTDVTESMRSVDALMKNFGITSKEAFNLIAQGAQQNLDFSGELIDSINEYSSQVKKLGLSAEDMFGMFASGAQNGAWNVDKIGDALKEFSIRSIDGSKTTQEGFTAIGKNANEMAQKFAIGGETARNAFFETIKGLNQMDDAVAQDAAGVALFGTMWEDLGKDVVLNLDKMGGAFDKNRQTMLEINKIKYDSFTKAIRGIGRQLSVAFIPIGESILPALNVFANWLSDNLSYAVESFSNVLNKVPKKIERFAEKMMSPLEKMKTQFVFGDFSQRAIENSDEIKEAFNAIGINSEEMAQRLSKGGEEAKNAFSETIQNLRQIDNEEEQAAIGTALFGASWETLGKDMILSMSSARSFLSGKVFSFLKENFQNVKNHMQEIKSVLAGLAGGFVALKTATVAGRAIKEITKEGNIANLAMGMLKKSLLANPFIQIAIVIGVLVGAFTLLYQKNEAFRIKVQEVWANLKQFGVALKDIVIAKLQELYGWFNEKIIPILSQIGQNFMELWTTIQPFAAWIADVFVSGLGIAFQNFFTVISAVLPYVQGVIEGLLTAFNGILLFLNGVFTGDWTKAWQGVQNIFSGVWQSIKSTFLGVIELIKGRINGITSQINNIAQKASNIPLIGSFAQKINLPQFATGTQYFSGGAAIVGEHGAELVQLPSGSKVTSTDKTKQMLKQSSDINVNIVIQGNMIGNEQYANQLGNMIVQKIMAAQYNI